MLYSNALPETFAPSACDVVVGKGKKYFKHEGNQMLRRLAVSMIAEYAEARTKMDKSLIISNVVDRIRDSGSFVKVDLASGRWLIAEDLLCREKTSAVFRDALHEYRKKGMPKTTNAGKRNRVEIVSVEKALPPQNKELESATPAQPATLFQGLELLQTLNYGKIAACDEDSISGLTNSLSCFRQEDLNFDDFEITEFL
ncbi:Nitrilase family, member 2 [Seminavis robusta]|uniref:Nitrilase family, member 2 n=1 Tax=Seminavis robusta TaxID=568900 RepID=A0A9N8GZK5_9STRA|nr:Nitrilase family, member 2 [Seminavis robusta]|eukprot:Sro5_g004220.1 Nitrilase family, member 2 (199) ;mRNA; r:91186-91782